MKMPELQDILEQYGKQCFKFATMSFAPFGLQFFKIAKLSLAPFGARIV